LSAWAYALHGVPMVSPAPLADDPDAQLGPDRMYLYTSMNRYGFDPEVARLVDELEVRWVVVGTGGVGGPGRPPGFIGLRFNPNLQLVGRTPTPACSRGCRSPPTTRRRRPRRGSRRPSRPCRRPTPTRRWSTRRRPRRGLAWTAWPGPEPARSTDAIGVHPRHGRPHRDSPRRRRPLRRG